MMTLKKDAKLMFSFTQKRFFLFVLIVGMLLIFIKPVYAAEPCKLVPTSEISSVDQAKCLLRQPKIKGDIGSTLTSLPSPLDQLLTKPTIDLDKATFRKYLQAKGIKESDIGGSLDSPVSRANDTSTPNFGNAPFPNDINEVSWRGNNLGNAPKVAHVFINRVGQSVTKVDFQTPFRATQYELQTNQRKGLFLNIESIQPRRCNPPSGVSQCKKKNNGQFENDQIAPDPGFTKAQLDRLAVVYIAASVRRGKWLIPAFHVVLDIGVGDHDDPQNFNLDQWSKQLNDILTEIRS
jgi:hypothetical protein